jgi:hypothetical protein
LFLAKILHEILALLISSSFLSKMIAVSASGAFSPFHKKIPIFSTDSELYRGLKTASRKPDKIKQKHGLD